MFGVGVIVPCENGVVFAIQQSLKMGPVSILIVLFDPQGAMEEDKIPPSVVVLPDSLLEVINLILAQIGALAVVAAEAEKENVLVSKMIVATLESFFPNSGHDFVTQIMVPGHVEEGDLLPLEKRFELIPLTIYLIDILGVALNQIAHGHDELRLKKLSLAKCIRKYSRAIAARAIGYDEKLKIAAVIFETKMCVGSY